MTSNHEVSAYLFHQGTNYRAYEFMGVHREGDSISFRVWAPNAEQIHLIGDFNEWRDDIPMQKMILLENGME